MCSGFQFSERICFTDAEKSILLSSHVFCIATFDNFSVSAVPDFFSCRFGDVSNSSHSRESIETPSVFPYERVIAIDWRAVARVGSTEVGGRERATIRRWCTVRLHAMVRDTSPINRSVIKDDRVRSLGLKLCW